MHLDVVDLQTFYAGPLGAMTHKVLSRIIRTRWENCVGMSMMGFGYASPYLELFCDEAMRVLAFMPAQQGVVNWPAAGHCASALVETDMLPLPDSCIDRILLIHALEVSDNPQDLLSEAWRILTPGGRLILIAPSRAGLWSRADVTPFGHGRPYSRGQLRDLMRETLFSPIHWGEALYGAPSARRLFLRAAPAIEAFGAQFSLPGAGVLIVEATKQLYRPVSQRRIGRHSLPMPEPAMLPTGARIKPTPIRFDS